MLVTVAVAIAGGAILTSIAQRLKTPVIVLLLLAGVVLGPQVANVVRPDSLGDALQVLVSLAVCLILFEGGLTLDVGGFRQAPAVIRRLLTVGVLVTWLGTAAAIWLIFRLTPVACLLAASLVIVTGPTVIAPLLKRLQVRTQLEHILRWEGVLIDPIGVFIAILCFEMLDPAGGWVALGHFAVRVAVGLGVGLAGAFAGAWALEHGLLPRDSANVAAIGIAVTVYGAAEIVGHSLDSPETGLLAVVVAGFVLGLRGVPALRQIRRFKADVTELMIGMLFILLAARLDLGQFLDFGWRGLLLVAVVMLVVRPLNVLASTVGAGLGWRDLVFLGWIAPRGIVAASMASLFALQLTRRGVLPEAAVFLETFTYSVIAATVVLQGLTAGPLVKLLGLKRERPRGWMIVGAHALGRAIARFVDQRAGVPAVLVDSNLRLVSQSQAAGLVAVAGDARRVELADHPTMAGVGRLLAITGNEDLNALVCQRWAETLGADGVYCWRSSRAPGASHGRIGNDTRTGRVVWSRLPSPAVIAAEIGRGEAMLAEFEAGQRHDPAWLPLVSATGEQVEIEPPPSPRASPSAVLALRREADYLRRALHRQLVVRLERADDLETVLSELVERMVAFEPSLSLAATIADLIGRERSLPTTLGHGVAVPHTYCPGLDTRRCALARVPGGLDLGAHDDEPVRLVFLLLSPSGDPEGHLATLADIARLVSDPENRRRLLEEEDPDAVLAFVAEVEAG